MLAVEVCSVSRLFPEDGSVCDPAGDFQYTERADLVSSQPEPFIELLPAGIEPTHMASEANALSTELGER